MFLKLSFFDPNKSIHIYTCEMDINPYKRVEKYVWTILLNLYRSYKRWKQSSKPKFDKQKKWKTMNHEWNHDEKINASLHHR